MDERVELNYATEVSTAPAKIGVLLDQLLPPTRRFDQLRDLPDGLTRTADEAVETDKHHAAEQLREAAPDAIVVLGFGFAVPQFNEALASVARVRGRARRQ